MYHYTMCGLPNVYLVNGYKEHKSPYGEGIAIDDTKGLHKAIGLSLIEAKTRFSGDEIRFLRKEMLMSQKTLAEIFDVAEISVRKWENGSHALKGAGDRLLRALYREFATGISDIRSMVEEINGIANDEQHELRFKEYGKQGWRQEAA